MLDMHVLLESLCGILSVDHLKLTTQGNIISDTFQNIRKMTIFLILMICFVEDIERLPICLQFVESIVSRK
jgi:hypothetical protein